MGLCSRLCKSHHSHPLEFCTRCRLCISMQPIHAYIIHTARRLEVHRPRPFNRGFRISLQQLCLSSVHLMSCQLDDIGCTKDEHNFRRQSWNPHLKGRALEMHVSGVGPSTIPSDPGCFLCDAPGHLANHKSCGNCAASNKSVMVLANLLH